MQNALNRIDELQNEVIEKSKLVEGSQDYINQKMKLFKKDEELRKEMKNLALKEKDLTNNFLS